MRSRWYSFSPKHSTTDEMWRGPAIVTEMSKPSLVVHLCLAIFAAAAFVMYPTARFSATLVFCAACRSDAVSHVGRVPLVDLRVDDV